MCACGLADLNINLALLPKFFLTDLTSGGTLVEKMPGAKMAITLEYFLYSS